jgi:hypothetical protein
MKKLNKLQINPEKVMKNEELVTLRGGGEGDYGSNNGSGGGNNSSGRMYMLCNCNLLPAKAWWGCYYLSDVGNAILAACGNSSGYCSYAGSC